MQLSISRDGLVHYGDKAMILNPQPNARSENMRLCSAALAVSMSPSALHNASGLNEDCGVSGTQKVEPTSRTCFTIARLVLMLKL